MSPLWSLEAERRLSQDGLEYAHIDFPIRSARLLEYHRFAFKAALETSLKMYDERMDKVQRVQVLKAYKREMESLMKGSAEVIKKDVHETTVQLEMERSRAARGPPARAGRRSNHTSPPATRNSVSSVGSTGSSYRQPHNDSKPRTVSGGKQRRGSADSAGRYHGPQTSVSPNLDHLRAERDELMYRDQLAKENQLREESLRLSLQRAQIPTDRDRDRRRNVSHIQRAGEHRDEDTASEYSDTSTMLGTTGSTNPRHSFLSSSSRSSAFVEQSPLHALRTLSGLNHLTSAGQNDTHEERTRIRNGVDGQGTRDSVREPAAVRHDQAVPNRSQRRAEVPRRTETVAPVLSTWTTWVAPEAHRASGTSIRRDYTPIPATEFTREER